MANTVGSAFNQFMKDSVNLDNQRTIIARNSRDFLVKKINGFSGFLPLYSDKNIGYGSFARRTKIRDLDDIDLIFTLSANGCTWSEDTDGIVYIHTSKNSEDYRNFCHGNSSLLNSRMIINRFISSLKTIPHYSEAKIHRNMHSATFLLNSYEWNFDIVPAFFTAEDTHGRSFYIIPNGHGHWMKTDPRIDQKRITTINQRQKGQALNIIRLTKYWQKRSTTPRMPSYLLENLILNFCEYNVLSEYIDVAFIGLLEFLSIKIYDSLNDPKGIDGNLNTLSLEDKDKIAIKAKADLITARKAYDLEIYHRDQEKSIREWQTIFGSNFPDYTR